MPRLLIDLRRRLIWRRKPRDVFSALLLHIRLPACYDARPADMRVCACYDATHYLRCYAMSRFIVIRRYLLIFRHALINTFMLPDADAIICRHGLCCRRYAMPPRYAFDGVFRFERFTRQVCCPPRFADVIFSLYATIRRRRYVLQAALSPLLIFLHFVLPEHTLICCCWHMLVALRLLPDGMLISMLCRYAAACFFATAPCVICSRLRHDIDATPPAA